MKLTGLTWLLVRLSNEDEMSEQKFKVGDIVKGLGFERGVVINGNNVCYQPYNLKVNFGNCHYVHLTLDGKLFKDSPHPAIELVERPKKN